MKNKIVPLTFCIFVLIACVVILKAQTEIPAEPNDSEFDSPEIYAEEASTFLGYVKDAEGAVSLITIVEDTIGEGAEAQTVGIVEGDIILDEKSILTQPVGAKSVGKGRRWQLGKVPYVLPSNYPRKATVIAALNHISSKTKIEFIERTNETDYILFGTDSGDFGGYSHVGRKGGKQILVLNSDTGKWGVGTVIHEVLHALGIGHEHCRDDREAFVKINLDNVKPGLESQFKKIFDGQNSGVYDFSSVMHYPKTAFARVENGQKLVTIERINGSGSFGGKNKLSDRDSSGLDSYYAVEYAQRP